MLVTPSRRSSKGPSARKREVGGKLFLLPPNRPNPNFRFRPAKMSTEGETVVISIYIYRPIHTYMIP